MLFKRKRKPERIVPGLERTKDNREFFIPQINVIEDKRTTRKKFVSPIFGKVVKDDVNIPQDRQGAGAGQTGRTGGGAGTRASGAGPAADAKALVQHAASCARLPATAIRRVAP